MKISAAAYRVVFTIVLIVGALLFIFLYDPAEKSSNDPQAADSAESQFLVEMVFVQGGTFMMGCTPEQGYDCLDNEKPVHAVTLNDFYIGKYEVTQKQWMAVMGADNNPSAFNGDNLPVERVSWNEIQEFIRRLNQKTGENYNLPTEAEWEYAARGGNQSRGYKYSGSNAYGDAVWYSGNSGYKTHPVGTREANELGIHDMSGNVLEWVYDRYSNYEDHPQNDPQGSGTSSYRAIRGGDWYSDSWNARVSFRDFDNPDACGGNMGFRLYLGSGN